MRLNLTLCRRDGPSVDLAITADASVTVGELARVLLERDRHSRARCSAPTLALDGGPLAVDVAVADSRLRSGDRVRVIDASPGAGGGGQDEVAATLVVTSGPDAGADPFPLRPGVNTVGRARANDVCLRDPLVSKRHARIVVTDRVEIIDTESVNGLFIGGHAVPRATLRSDDRVVLGDTELQVVRPTATVADPEGSGQMFNRPPRLEPRYEGRDFDVPEPPATPARPPLSWAPFLAPLLLGPALYAVTQRVATLLFVALSPLLMMGTVIERRRSVRRDHRQAVARYRASVEALRAQLAVAREEEARGRRREHPPTAELAAAALARAPALWSARPDRPGFLDLRLGLGEAPGRNSVSLPHRRAEDEALWQELVALRDEAAVVEAVPIVAELPRVGCVGIAGGRRDALPVMRALVAQLVCRHSPVEVVLAAAVPTDAVDDWQWLKWLPHVTTERAPLAADVLAGSEASAARLVSALEELVAERGLAKPTERRALPAVVLLVEDKAPVQRSRLITLAESGPEVGIHLLWLAPSAQQLPAACRAFVELEGDGASSASAGFVQDGARTTLAPETMTAAAADELSRSMAPLVDAGTLAEDQSDLPPSVSLLALLGTGLAEDPEAVLEGWRSGGSLRETLDGGTRPAPARLGLPAKLGVGTAGEPFTLDLREHGPHALVGGTTGAGKSEFLQTWVASLAAAHSPKRVTFLFVDYKGEAAFGSCVELPHSVGLVSDLSPHLVRRALVSLRAELRHREHVLREHRAKDLLELERRGEPDVPPSLIIVVDEFAALVKEVPEFVDGVVDVAQRGRSLGLHLVLATQRPAGVIRENLRANTNLRVALRMADEDDSADILGIPDAAAFDPALPGRAMVKRGPGRVQSFQAAYVGGQTPGTPPPPPITVVERPFELGGEWQLATAETAAGTSTSAAHDVPSDLARFVATTKKAFEDSRLRPPRRPWLEELPPSVDLERIFDLKRNPYALEQAPSRRTDAELVFGVLDDPSHQRRRSAAFVPDRDGAMAIFGTGGSGKSTFLRTIALAAARTPDGGPCHVYGLDFGAQGLRLLDPHHEASGAAPHGGSSVQRPTRLPHVGAVIAGDDDERVVRLLRMLRGIVDERAVRYASVSASTIAEYRDLAKRPDEPRILLLVDEIGAFRATYETGPQARWFDLFQSLVADGRAVGLHVLLSADRATALPVGLASLVPRRLVLRLAGETHEHALMNVPAGAFTDETPPGRGFVGGLEVQVAVPNGSPSSARQADAIGEIAEVARREIRTYPAPVKRLPTQIALAELPVTVAGSPTLGIADDTLSPIAFTPAGPLIVAGPPGSGRTSVLTTLALSLQRARTDATLIRFGLGASPLQDLVRWDAFVEEMDDVVALAKSLAERVHSGHPPAIFIESFPDFAFLGSPADQPLQQLIKIARRGETLVVAEGETTAMASSGPLLQLVKAARHGIVLQPDQTDGDMILKTSFPRVTRAAFPPGRGLYARRGQVVRVQCALPEDANHEVPPTDVTTNGRPTPSTTAR